MFLRGIIPALITPFTKDSEVNYDSLKRIVELNLNKGVSGFYTCGSTGEAFMLTEEERGKITQTVVGQVNGRAKVIAHVGDIDTRKCIRLAKHAEQAGVDAVSAIPPFYYKFSFDEIYTHYRMIAEATNLPFIIYNFPRLSGVEFSVDQVRKLSEINNIVGMKHTSMDLYQMQKVKAMIPGFEIYCSLDEIYLAGRVMGSDAAIGSTYNVMAERFCELNRLIEENKIKEAEDAMKEACNIISVLVRDNHFNALRYVFETHGIPCGQSRSPFASISAQTRELLDNISFSIQADREVKA
jgi:N-acetylneuraminate lyase